MTHPGLNFGCGPDLPAGWENADFHEYEQWNAAGATAWRRPFDDAHDIDGRPVVADLLDGLPWPDETFDYIVTNHALQMIRYVDLMPALTELTRLLKPGGVVRILVPDLLRAMAAYDAGDAAWFPIVDDAETTIGGKLCAYVTWYSEARTVFTPAWLMELVDRAGLEAALGAVSFSPLGYHTPLITSLDSRPHESIVVEGQKR